MPQQLAEKIRRRTDLDNRIARAIAGPETASQIPVEKWVGKGAFYLLMLFVLVAFFHSVGLTVVTVPLTTILEELFAFAPQLLSAALLLLLAWIAASVLRRITHRLLTVLKADERLAGPAGVVAPDVLSLPQHVGNLVYWLVFLLFLPAVLGALQLYGLLQPIRDMLGTILGFLPNLFASALILLVGWFTARIVQRVVTNLLAPTSLNRLGETSGLNGILRIRNLSGLIGSTAYGLILILVVIAALDALKFDVISGPTQEMLSRLFTALPAIFTAGLVLIVALMAGRFVGRLVSDLLDQAGFDGVLARLGLGTTEPAEGQATPSTVAGYLTTVAILLVAGIEAAQLLGFEQLGGMMVQLTVFAGNVLLGLVIFGFGVYLAKLCAGLVAQKSSQYSRLLSGTVRLAILILTTSMALRQMGIADEIISLAFGLLLGAIAVAAAIAFGLGSRDIAARQLEKWLDSCKNDDR